MIRAAFAYYDGPFYEVPAEPSYLILESDHPKLPVHGNVCGEQLMEAGVNLPVTPTYRTWLNMGSPVFRGEKR